MRPVHRTNPVEDPDKGERIVIGWPVEERDQSDSHQKRPNHLRRHTEHVALVRLAPLVPSRQPARPTLVAGPFGDPQPKHLGGWRRRLI